MIGMLHGAIWLTLGVTMFGLGFLYELFCCAPKQRFGNEKRDFKRTGSYYG